MAGIDKKKEPDYYSSPNGKEMSVSDFEDNSGRASIGMPIQEQTIDLSFNQSPKMKRRKEAEIFDAPEPDFPVPALPNRGEVKHV